MSNAVRQQGVVILGSTGSVGGSALDVVAALPDRFRLVGLAAATNQRLLQQQIDTFQPSYAHLATGGTRLTGVEQIDNPEALTHLATLDDADIIVVATTGHTAIEPTIQALRAGKIVALANKETIVAAGEIVMREARTSTGILRTVDSEHSALWQCLGSDRFDPERVRRLIITASGGPFRGWTSEQLSTVRPADALKHPNWNMGDKITIDSATLMNKGLEIIEAHWLFDCPLDAISVVVHPQSIVHSMVELHDGSLIAQIASHDMRVPIQYALTFPDRVLGPGKPINLVTIGELTFEEPNLEAFPLLTIARDAAAQGSTYPTVLSAADSVAVEAFLAGRLSFLGISRLVQESLDAHTPSSGPLTLAAVREADTWAEQYARQLVEERSSQWK
ncbi:1-deoxy-D-xylulose-5-phosphate reductoisomerase [soil metagenome]